MTNPVADPLAARWQGFYMDDALPFDINASKAALQEWWKTVRDPEPMLVHLAGLAQDRDGLHRKRLTMLYCAIARQSGVIRQGEGALCFLESWASGGVDARKTARSMTSVGRVSLQTCLDLDIAMAAALVASDVALSNNVASEFISLVTYAKLMMNTCYTRSDMTEPRKGVAAALAALIRSRIPVAPIQPADPWFASRDQ